MLTTNSCLAKVSEDLRLIASWCCTNKLLINPDKTKLILFGTKQLLSKVLAIRVPFLGQQLIPVSSVKDLGIILDSNLTFNEHVNTLASSLISILCQISRVRHLFSKSVLTTILNCLVFCKLFYCSTVWSGTFAYNINKLQHLYRISPPVCWLTPRSLITSHQCCAHCVGLLLRISY